MQQEEFEHRTGLKVTVAEYKKIEEIYNNAGDLDKDAFCRDYTNDNGREVMAALSDKCEELRGLTRKLDRRIAELEEERMAMVDFLITMHCATGEEPLRKQALSMVGRKRYIIRKCKMNITLDSQEQAWIINLLEEE